MSLATFWTVLVVLGFLGLVLHERAVKRVRAEEAARWSARLNEVDEELKRLRAETRPPPEETSDQRWARWRAEGKVQRLGTDHF